MNFLKLIIKVSHKREIKNGMLDTLTIYFDTLTFSLNSK